MLSKLIRHLLFNLLHFVVTVLVAVENVYHQVWTKMYSKPYHKVTKSDITMLMNHVPSMKKKLKHLVILADTDHQSLSDLACLVIWSLIAGIPYVSFHDITGQLKENEEKLFLEVERNKKGVPGYIKWSKKPDLNGYTNGAEAHTVNINIFSYCDGKPLIAQCIQEIAEEKVSCRKESTEFTAQELNETLSLYYPKIPDPELVLYSGALCCTHGLLPWHIRLAEFVQLSLDHSVNIKNYIGALYKYNKCDQRFGK